MSGTLPKGNGHFGTSPGGQGEKLGTIFPENLDFKKVSKSKESNVSGRPKESPNGG